MSLILGFLWFGIMQQFSEAFSEPGLQWELESFRNISGIFVIFFAIFNGIFGSIVLTVLVGLGGLVYNLVNSKGGGIELEISYFTGSGGEAPQSALPRDSTRPGLSGEGGSEEETTQRGSHNDTV